MAGRKSSNEERLSAEEKIARAVALIAIRNVEDQYERAVVLRTIGFNVSEIAAMLGITPNNASVALHRAAKKTKRKGNHR